MRVSNKEKNQFAILEKIRSLFIPHFTQKWRDNANSRMNLYKI